MKTLPSLTLLAILLIPPGAAQQDPRWVVAPNINDLDDWNVEPNSPALAKAMGDAAELVLRWKVPGSAADWQARRPHVDEALRKSLGLERLPERTPLQARTVASHDRGDYIVENILFETRPGFPIPANLYRPKTPPAARVPAVLCPIGHLIPDGKRDTEVQARSIKLAKMGFVVLAYDAIGHGERNVSGNSHHEAGFALLPLGETVTGWMVWDSMRAIDYLQSRPDVDASRIGVTGNSGGGLNTLYTAALDPRVTVAAITGYTFEFNNWIKYGGAHGTCSYLPGLFREMEWFEIAGLIAPRPVLMLNGERDAIFPISGARKAAYSTRALYSLLGHGDRARFYGVPKQNHAYSRPYREQMYGLMAKHLLGQGDGGPLDEGQIDPLPEDDPRLLCDPEGTLMDAAPSVVRLARERGSEVVRQMPAGSTPSARAALLEWVKDLTAPPDPEPHNLMPIRIEESQGGGPEKVYFLSEIGQFVPGLLWKPESARPRRTILIVDETGKGAVAESGLAEALRGAGNAVLAIDTRGRGETLGVMGRRDNNYHLVSILMMAGRPLAGRRAFDLTRAVDFIARRDDLPLDDLTVVARGDDALPVLLAAAADERIRRVVAAGYFHSFVSQMVAGQVDSQQDLVNQWNQMAMRHGRIQGDRYTVDLGAVIPSSLRHGDIPDIVSLLGARKVLFCDAKDGDAPDLAAMRERFVRVNGASITDRSLTYEPAGPLTTERLLGWLGN
jgi:cephalosporin-C deacetylase-like acetyl esterase